jgi:hypothetical protein
MGFASVRRVHRLIIEEAFRAKNLELPRPTVVSSAVQLYPALLATGRFLSVRSAFTLRVSGKRLSEKALPVDLPIRPVYVGIVTLKHRPLSPATQLL